MDLKYKRKNVYEEADGKKLEEIYKLSEGYKAFLDSSKTERDASITAQKLAEENGFKPFSFSEKLKAGDKRYFINRHKNVFLIKVGTENVEKDGVRIMVAHVDSPRLDLKPNPMYEDSGLCYFKTHYYGGIKKYQWTAIPLALHGIAVLRGGKRVEICVGEDENDPVFYITDLLPHLGAEQAAKFRPSRTSIGMPRWRASPLPEPHGMMPRAVCEPHNASAVSLTVPSPPAANTAS